MFLVGPGRCIPCKLPRPIQGCCKLLRMSEVLFHHASFIFARRQHEIIPCFWRPNVFFGLFRTEGMIQLFLLPSMTRNTVEDSFHGRYLSLKGLEVTRFVRHNLFLACNETFKEYFFTFFADEVPEKGTMQEFLIPGHRGTIFKSVASLPELFEGVDWRLSTVLYDIWYVKVDWRIRKLVT